MLRDCIQTKAQLNNLVSSLQDSLALGDPRDIAAKLLGFDDANDMATYYSDVERAPCRTLYGLQHNYDGGSETYVFLSEKDPNANNGFLALIGPLQVDFRPDCGDHDLFFSPPLVKDLSLSQAQSFINVDNYVGYCVLDDGSRLTKEICGGESLSIDDIIDRLANVRQELDTTGYWGNDYHYSSTRFGCFDRPKELDDSTSCAAIIKCEGFTSNADHYIDAERGIYAEYQENHLKRVIFFSV